jgi:hypothetical protein
MVNVICKRQDLLELAKSSGWQKVLELGPAANPYEFSTHLIDYENFLPENHPGKFIQIDLNQIKELPFEDGYFDFVVASHVLEHLVDPFHVMREISRVGKRGYLEVPTRLADNLFSWFGETDSLGNYVTDKFGHKWWFDLGYGGSLVVSERLRVVSRYFSSFEAEYLGKFFESQFSISILWEQAIDFQHVQLGSELRVAKAPRPLNFHSMPKPIQPIIRIDAMLKNLPESKNLRRILRKFNVIRSSE